MKTVIIDTAREGQVLLSATDGSDAHALSWDGGRGGKLRSAFAYAYGEMNADAVITLPAAGEYGAEDIEKVASALEEGASAVVCDLSEPSPILFGWAFKLLTRFTAGLTAAPWASLRGYRADCAGLLASVKGEGADYEVALLQAIVTEKLPLVQLSAEKDRKNSGAKCKKSLKNTILAGLGIVGQSHSLKFLISSMIALLIDTTLLMLIAPLLPWEEAINEVVAQTAAWIVSSLTNFNINRRLVFRAKGGTLAALGQYYSLAVFVMLGKQGLLFVFSTLLSLPLLLSKIVCEVSFFFLNYFVQKKLIFSRKKAKSECGM